MSGATREPWRVRQRQLAIRYSPEQMWQTARIAVNELIPPDLDTLL